MPYSRLLHQWQGRLRTKNSSRAEWSPVWSLLTPFHQKDVELSQRTLLVMVSVWIRDGWALDAQFQSFDHQDPLATGIAICLCLFGWFQPLEMPFQCRLWDQSCAAGIKSACWITEEWKFPQSGDNHSKKKYVQVALLIHHTRSSAKLSHGLFGWQRGEVGSVHFAFFLVWFLQGIFSTLPLFSCSSNIWLYSLISSGSLKNFRWRLQRRWMHNS